MFAKAVREMHKVPDFQAFDLMLDGPVTNRAGLIVLHVRLSSIGLLTLQQGGRT